MLEQNHGLIPPHCFIVLSLVRGRRDFKRLSKLILLYDGATDSIRIEILSFDIKERGVFKQEVKHFSVLVLNELSEKPMVNADPSVSFKERSCVTNEPSFTGTLKPRLYSKLKKLTGG